MNEKLFVSKLTRPLLLCCFFVGITTMVFAQRSHEKNNLSANKKTRRVLYGQASFYANKFHGRRTANGEIFSQSKFTAACNVLPLGTWIRVTNLKNGKTVIVKTNDRLHPKSRRIVDLTKAAAQKLGFISRGLTRVKVEIVDHNANKETVLPTGSSTQ